MKVAAQLRAIALLTLREAVRRKTFLVLVFFAVAVLSSMTFFASVDPESRLRLLEMWSLRATVFFAALVAIFLGAFTLPGDFEEKRIQVIATKPVTKSTFLLGRYLGMALTVAIFVGVMGLVSLGFLKTVKWIEGDAVPDLRARPIVSTETMEGIGRLEEYKLDTTLLRTVGQVPGTLFWRFQDLPPGTNRIGGMISIDNPFFPDRSTGRTRFLFTGAPGKSHEEERTLRVDTPFDFEFPSDLIEKGFPLQIAVTPAQGDLRLEARQDSVRVGGLAATRFLAQGSARQLESPPRLQTQGWAKSALSWKFERPESNDHPDPVPGRFRVSVDSIQGRFRFTGPARVVVRTADGARHVEREIFAKSNEWTGFTFPRAFLDSGQDIVVSLVTGDDDMRISGRSSSCQLFEKDESFSWNILKGFALIYGWILLILTVTVTASSVLSAPVSVLAGVVVLLVGATHGFVAKGVKDFDRSLVRYYEAEKRGEKARTPENYPPWVLEYSRTGSRIALFLFPDSSHFDFSSFLLEDLAVRGTDLWNAWKAVFSRIVILLLLAVVAMINKDFG